MDILVFIIIAVISLVGGIGLYATKHRFIYVAGVFALHFTIQKFVTGSFAKSNIGESILLLDEIFMFVFVIFGIARLWDYIDSKRKPKVHSAKQQVTGKVFQEIIRALFR